MTRRILRNIWISIGVGICIVAGNAHAEDRKKASSDKAVVVAPDETPSGGRTAYQTSADFAKYAMKLRESALIHMEPRTVIATTSRSVVSGRYSWKTGIVTTVFWFGKGTKETRAASAWDQNWLQSFGGYDNPDPSARRNFIPAKFTPRQNPFYIALPYNDVTRDTTKPEARQVIPWFKEAFEAEGKSVCRDRWVAIRNSSGKVGYGQWSDCGPFRTDHWQYVFGNESPKPNPNQGAGLNVSPALRDFLGLESTDVTDWKFVDVQDVPTGPWAQYGDNNTLVQRAGRNQERVISAGAAPGNPESPTVKFDK